MLPLLEAREASFLTFGGDEVQRGGVESLEDSRLPPLFEPSSRASFV